MIHASFSSRFARVDGDRSAALHGTINGHVGTLVRRYTGAVRVGVA